MEFPDLIWTILGILLTLMIFSYVWGDNPFFRTASYLFVGVTAGYVAVLLITQVILPRLAWPLLRTSTPTEKTIAAVGVVLALLLLTKLVRPLAWLGNLPMAYLTGAGAAVVIGGAVLGTIIPQTLDGITAFAPGGQLIDGLFMLIGTIATLAYFHFGARSRNGEPPGRGILVEGLSQAGKVFIGITLGALFAGVMAASLTALIERVDFLVTSLTQF